MIGEDKEPTAELDPQFSSEDASSTPWATAREQLQNAEVYWLSTVRPDGQPHVTSLVAVWLDGALYFCTGETERKARNLSHNAHCIITTGCNTLSDGLDLVVEGEAVRISDESRLQRVADSYASKYDLPFHFTVRNDVFLNSEGGEALVYEVAPVTVFGFGRGKTFSQTRWRF
ncbi:MAG: pyridoxamine 5'-phosphate oxidase family protein [Chloroflexi bacterium]|nr:MAG: pyridoxamine 5'-phosphate oxidase family protein [Chloroflexota bacterium]